MTSAAATRPSGPPTAPGARGVLSDANFLRIFLAGAISTGGSAFSNLALVWVVFERTGSALDLAAVGVVGLAASILVTLPAGVWVDRYPRRTLMVLSDLVRAGCSAALALTLLVLGFSLLAVLVVTFAWAAAGSLFQPAEQSLLPSIVRKEHIADANGLIRSSRSAVALAANTAAGTLILIVGVVPSFWVNALTYVVSAVLVSAVAVRGREVLGRGPAPRAMWKEIREGMRWLYGEKGLFQLSLSATPLNFCSSLFNPFLVVFTVVLLHGSALVLGLLLAVSTVGDALGSLLVGRVGAVHFAGKAWLLAYGVGSGLLIIALAADPQIYLAFVLLFLQGLVSNFGGNSWLSASQVLVPEEMRGRYFAVDGLISFGVLPAAEVVGGLLIGLYGVRTTFLLAGIGMTGTGLLFSLAGPLWRWGVPRGGRPAPPSSR